MELETVRIPELVPQASLTLEDKIPVYIDADGKTRHSTLQALYNLIHTGSGGGSYAPVYLGGSVIYKVPPGMAGNNTAVIPALAGKDFLLRRAGNPLEPGTEYEILNAGGFKLMLPDDVFFEGEKFELDVFSLQTGPTPAPGTGSGGPAFKGVVPITTNLTLNATDHLNKLLRFRAGTDAVTVTLFDVEDPDVPDYTIVELESIISTSRQCRVTTQGGQNIYMREASYTSLYIAPGETLRLMKDEDGWYVLDNAFPMIYDRLGQIMATYKVGRNQLYCDGSIKLRAQYPRLWAAIQQMGFSLVTDAQWNTASVVVDGQTVEKPFRGCFSTGDGSTTFRLPDLRNLALRGIKESSDPQRHHNNPGGYQKHRYEWHNHGIPINATTDGGSGAIVGGAPTASDGDVVTFSVGGNETRMDNAGVFWCVYA